MVSGRSTARHSLITSKQAVLPIRRAAGLCSNLNAAQHGDFAFGAVHCAVPFSSPMAWAWRTFVEQAQDFIDGVDGVAVREGGVRR